MGLAFFTGAIASGFTAAGLTALLIWIATVLAGSSDPWSIAPVAGDGGGRPGGHGHVRRRRNRPPSIARPQALHGRAMGLPRGLTRAQWPRSTPWPLLEASATTLSAMLCGTSA